MTSCMAARTERQDSPVRQMLSKMGVPLTDTPVVPNSHRYLVAYYDDHIGLGIPSLEVGEFSAYDQYGNMIFLSPDWGYWEYYTVAGVERYGLENGVRTNNIPFGPAMLIRFNSPEDWRRYNSMCEEFHLTGRVHLN